MSGKNIFWWLALAIWSAGATWWHTCKIKQLCDAPMVADVGAVDVKFPLEIIDGSSLSLVSPGNFGFAKSGADANYRVVQREIDSLAAYLKVNPDKQVTITGYYTSAEVNGTKWPDLGIARAEGIKKYYVNHGLPENMFVTKSELKEDIKFSPDSLNGGIAFGFTNKTSETKLAEAQKFEGIFEELDLYFNTGSTEYIKTADNQKFLEEAQKYLAANKEKKLLLTGQTDNVGTRASNAVLARERANQAKKQLISLGLPEAQLTTDSKGQTKPKVSNATAEGKAANRRVAIVVVK